MRRFSWYQVAMTVVAGGFLTVAGCGQGADDSSVPTTDNVQAAQEQLSSCASSLRAAELASGLEPLSPSVHRAIELWQGQVFIRAETVQHDFLMARNILDDLFNRAAELPVEAVVNANEVKLVPTLDNRQAGEVHQYSGFEEKLRGVLANRCSF